MLRTWLSSLRARLILLVLFALLPALALILYTGLDQRRSAAQRASDEALRLANIASYNQEIFVEQVRGLLKTLSLLPQIREASPSECSQLLALPGALLPLHSQSRRGGP